MKFLLWKLLIYFRSNISLPECLPKILTILIPSKNNKNHLSVSLLYTIRHEYKNKKPNIPSGKKELPTCIGAHKLFIIKKSAPEVFS